MAISIRVNAEAWERIFGDKPEDAALGITHSSCSCTDDNDCSCTIVEGD